jgi:hypothetical protein
MFVPKSSFGLLPFLYPFPKTLLVCVHESGFGLRPNWLYPFFIYVHHLISIDMYISALFFLMSSGGA